VDAPGGLEKDQFVRGGKVNDTSTWNVEASTIGSGKYDITQGHLANNFSSLFFASYRRTNTGTTEFEYEFNQQAPAGFDPTGQTPVYIPTRTGDGAGPNPDDVLFAYEMDASKKTLDVHIFLWDGNGFDVELGTPGNPPLPAGIVKSFNDADTPAGPWGFVNEKGDWDGGFGDASPRTPVPALTLGEVGVPLSVLGITNPCGQTFYVQYRSRASVSETSDLKDGTPIFNYTFGGPTAAAVCGSNCLQQLTFSGAGSTAFSPGATLTYLWDFLAPAGVTLSGTGITADGTIPNLYHSTAVSGTINVAPNPLAAAVTIGVSLTVTENGQCTDTATASNCVVYPILRGTLTPTLDCDDTFSLAATAAGGVAPYTFDWVISKGGTMYPFPNGGTSLNLDIDNLGGDGAYSAQVTITDSRSCTAVLSQGPFTIIHPANPSASKTNTASDGSSVTLTAADLPTVGDVTQQWQKKSGATFGNITGETATTLSRTVAQIKADDGDGSSNVTFTVAAGDAAATYKGPLWVSTYRVEVKQTLDAGTTFFRECITTSPGVAVKRVEGTDP
jgi:hypothetical protein